MEYLVNGNNDVFTNPCGCVLDALSGCPGRWGGGCPLGGGACPPAFCNCDGVFNSLSPGVLPDASDVI